VYRSIGRNLSYKDEPLERYVLYLDSVAGILSDSSERIHEFFDTGRLTVFQQLSGELAQTRGRYPAPPNIAFEGDRPQAGSPST
jgi:hypothetical protein